MPLRRVCTCGYSLRDVLSNMILSSGRVPQDNKKSIDDRNGRSALFEFDSDFFQKLVADFLVFTQEGACGIIPSAELVLAVAV